MCAQSFFTDELIKNAQVLRWMGSGILAADDSTAAIGKRLSSVNLANTEENRRRLRELLICTPFVLDDLSGVILSEEALHQKTSAGVTFVDLLTSAHVLPGIRVDKGTVALAGTDNEPATQGHDGLAERCAKYYQDGARFARWRAVFRIGHNSPSQLAIDANASGLARYAVVCQESGLVPIVETDVLADGSHDIGRCAEATEMVIAACYKALFDHHVLLEGTILMLNMVTPGSQAVKVSPQVVAEYTRRVVQRTVPVAVPAIMFLSGRQGEEEATLNLDAINMVGADRPWSLSFLFGRALQRSALKAWAGKEENVEKASMAFFIRCGANSQATAGRYKGYSRVVEGVDWWWHGCWKGLHVKKYNYPNF